MKTIEEIAERIKNKLYSASCLSINSSFVEDYIFEILREELNPSPPSGDMEERLNKFLPDNEGIAIEIVASFLNNPHPNQRANYDREKKAFANGALWMRGRAIQFAQQELTSQRWIPVGERLPELSPDTLSSKRVLAYANFPNHSAIVTAGYSLDNGWMSRGEKVPVSHWQPLPDKPNQD